MRIQTKHVIDSLPLVADVLGRRYGIRVEIGGGTAATNGKAIFLPSLPLDSGVNVLNLVRGYIDHESAHLRHTDFDALNSANLTPVEKFFWNILEDCRVEKKLAAVFPGCRRNLEWLCKHHFLDERKNSPEPAENPALRIFEWTLLYARSRDVPEFGQVRDRSAQMLDWSFPGLRPELEAVLDAASASADTRDCIDAARELARVVGDYKPPVLEREPEQPDISAGHERSVPQGGTQGDDTDSAVRQLQRLLADPDPRLPKDLGETLREFLQARHQEGGEQLSVAIPVAASLRPFPPQELADAQRATTALRTRLQALLQSVVLARNRLSRAGHVDPNRLARLAVNDPRVFMRKGKRQGMNTAVHILLDSSGSMQGAAIVLACKACFAVALSLDAIHGVGVAVTSFPGSLCDTVAPLLKHRERLHDRFMVCARGNTPLAEAVWWVIQQMRPLAEERKIILFITDGRPNSVPLAQNAIRAAKNAGLEVYGVGIHSQSIKNLLPEGGCRVINSLPELAPAMFSILQNALVRQAQGGAR
jgi:Mg-chelatase subunit ChlD